VTSFVWGGKVEKLGLDELFLDVTEQINSHLKSILPTSPTISSTQIFHIDTPSNPSGRTFTYPFGTHEGHLEPSSNPISSPAIPFSTLQLFVASHFAQHIRAELFSTLGYTTSAGIASTKLVAKLLSDLHKPALQSLQNPYTSRLEWQDWLDKFKVEKLNGFGFRTGWILRNKILGEEMPPRGAFGDADKVNGSFLDDGYSEGLLNGRPSSGTLTVGKVRTSCTPEEFLSWFGERLGPRLWGLLHGEDDGQVIPTPTFPKQISVEDSYPDNRTLGVLFANLAILTKSLVRRLDHDLTEKGIYIRFPKTLRLSMRNHHTKTPRESKSARMPVELFDLTLPKERRVELVLRTVTTLAKTMIGSWPPDWRVGVINIAATDLMEEIPGFGIQKFIANAKKAEVEEVDWDFIRELPEDIQEEVLRRYRLSPDKLKSSMEAMDVDPQSVPESEDMKIDGISSGETDQSDEDWDDVEDGDLEDTKDTCGICGVRIFSWMREAHNLYHRENSYNA
jgi:DNA polymerase iota